MVVGDDHLASIDEVAAALEAAGLHVGAVLGASGVITGTTAHADDLDALALIDGVAAVEAAGDVQLPPPESPIQ